jgi:hypothetical protein
MHTDFLMSILAGEAPLHTCHDDLFSQYVCSSGYSSVLNLRSHYIRVSTLFAAETGIGEVTYVAMKGSSSLTRRLMTSGYTTKPEVTLSEKSVRC